MDEDAMLMVGVSLFLESYCDDLFDLMELVESDIEDHVIRIKEYTRILKLLETATDVEVVHRQIADVAVVHRRIADVAVVHRRIADVEAIRRRILDVEFDLRYSMVLYNVICERIVFTTK
jgi:hypothetical protein